MNLRLLAAALLLPLVLNSCKILQLPFNLIRSVTGFVSYSLVRTDDGGVSVTVCQDKAGTDESLGLARNWIQEHASDLQTSPPAVSEGSVILQLS